MKAIAALVGKEWLLFPFGAVFVLAGVVSIFLAGISHDPSWLSAARISFWGALWVSVLYIAAWTVDSPGVHLLAEMIREWKPQR